VTSPPTTDLNFATDRDGPARPPNRLEVVPSTVVRDLVAEGGADLGAAASRPNRTPYPGMRELPLAVDAAICAVPYSHRWASREEISLEDFLGARIVMRDPSSNSRRTVEAVLRERGLSLPPALVEAGTPTLTSQEAKLEAPRCSFSEACWPSTSSTSSHRRPACRSRGSTC